LLALAWFLTVGMMPGRASLGETMDQCVARYGQAVTPMVHFNDVSDGSLWFKTDDYFINAIFFHGVVGAEIIRKRDGSKISDDELDAILQTESAGGSWNRVTTLVSDKMWTRKDGAGAVYFVITGKLSLSSGEYQAALQLKNSARKKAP